MEVSHAVPVRFTVCKETLEAISVGFGFEEPVAGRHRLGLSIDLARIESDLRGCAIVLHERVFRRGPLQNRSENQANGDGEAPQQLGGVVRFQSATVDRFGSHHHGFSGGAVFESTILPVLLTHLFKSVTGR